MQKKGGTKRAQAEAGQSDRCEHDLVSPVPVRLSSYGAASVKRSRLRKAAPPLANGINGDGRASKRASDCPSGRENDTDGGTGGDVPGKYLALPPLGEKASRATSRGVPSKSAAERKLTPSVALLVLIISLCPSLPPRLVMIPKREKRPPSPSLIHLWCPYVTRQDVVVPMGP